MFNGIFENAIGLPVKEVMFEPTKLTLHPAVELFPEMDADAFQSLKEDLQANGQVHAIIATTEGQIVDGRHRWKACIALGLRISVRRFWGEERDILPYVISSNLKRRHLTESQRAMVAARIANLKPGRPEKTGAIAPVSQTDAAEQLNVSRDSVKRAARVQRDGIPELARAVDTGEIAVSTAAEIATLDTTEQAEIVARGEAEILRKAKEIKAQKHAERKIERLEVIKAMPWPEGKYRVIYADPPWAYDNAGLQVSAAKHYETMSTDAIGLLPVADLATKDAVLFMWATSPLLPDALRVVDAWGFTYKTSIVWDKARPNFGNYVSVQHEFLLVATRGACTPDIAERPGSVMRIERTDRHSEKPSEFRDLVDRLYPHGPRIELFARQAADGWQRWGNEAA